MDISTLPVINSSSHINHLNPIQRKLKKKENLGPYFSSNKNDTNQNPQRSYVNGSIEKNARIVKYTFTKSSVNFKKISPKEFTRFTNIRDEYINCFKNLSETDQIYFKKIGKALFYSKKNTLKIIKFFTENLRANDKIENSSIINVIFMIALFRDDVLPSALVTYIQNTKIYKESSGSAFLPFIKLSILKISNKSITENKFQVQIRNIIKSSQKKFILSKKINFFIKETNSIIFIAIIIYSIASKVLDIFDYIKGKLSKGVSLIS